MQIGDFGMARDISDNGFYLGNDGKVPLKWTAPEAISLKKYSIASDVWSYGCLLYEIWSFGVKPFKGLKNEEVGGTEVIALPRIMQCGWCLSFLRS